MTPAQHISKIAKELMSLNPKITASTAYLNAIITYLDISGKDVTTAQPEEQTGVVFPQNKLTPMREDTLKKTIDAQDVKITVETDGRKLVLDVPWEADIFAWEQKLNLILRWLTFRPDTISLILGSEECGGCNCDTTQG